jgi:hypothetical protein
MQQTYYGQQFGMQNRSVRKQSPALETPLPEFVPPQGQRGQGTAVRVQPPMASMLHSHGLVVADLLVVCIRNADIMIIWDFQNVRTPTELEPTDIIR